MAGCIHRFGGLAENGVHRPPVMAYLLAARKWWCATRRDYLAMATESVDTPELINDPLRPWALD